MLIPVKPAPGGGLVIAVGFWACRHTTNRVVSTPSGFESHDRPGTLESAHIVLNNCGGQPVADAPTLSTPTTISG